MGKGRFIGTELDLYVSLDFDASSDVANVEDIFVKLSDRFYQAMDGKLSIANIYWIDNSIGRNIADAFFRQDPHGGILGQALPNGLGVYGSWMEVFNVREFSAAKNEQLASVSMHEFGHYAWNLGDEYAGPSLTGPLDLTEQEAYENANTAPYRYVFLLADFDIFNPAADENYDLTDGEVSVFLNDAWQTGFVTTATIGNSGAIELYVQYGAGFSEPPSSSTEDVRVRPFGQCGIQNADFCVMNGRGGEVNRREFCVDGNHDPDRLTAQSYRHGGLDCWEVIKKRMFDSWTVVLETPLVADPVTGPAPAPNLIKLSVEKRFVLVLDRSGSMDENDKIEGARGGLELWLDFAGNQNDRIGIVWFNSVVNPVLAIENVASITDLEQVKDQVLGLPADGATNIKDAVDQAADMLIQDAAFRGPAVQQCIVLMTDGVHNVPPPSAVALDAIPKCQENGIQIFTLGLGDSTNVNTTNLEDLAKQTSGRALSAIGLTGEDQDQLVFDLLWVLRQELWGSMAANVELGFDELSAGSKLDETIRKWRRGRERPPLDTLMDVAGADSIQELVKDKAALCDVFHLG